MLIAFVRQEVPVDDVAERFVDADTVLIDGKPLRHAVDGRRLEAAKLNVGLKLVALQVADDQTRDLRQQRILKDGRAGSFNVGRIHLINAARHFLDRNFATAQRRHLYEI